MDLISVTISAVATSCVALEKYAQILEKLQPPTLSKQSILTQPRRTNAQPTSAFTWNIGSSVRITFLEKRNTLPERSTT